MNFSEYVMQIFCTDIYNFVQSEIDQTGGELCRIIAERILHHFYEIYN